MKKMIWALLLVVLVPTVVSAAGTVGLRPYLAHGRDTFAIFYDGPQTPGVVMPYLTYPFNLYGDVDSDTKLMGYTVGLRIPKTKITCLDTGILPGTFLTSADTYFFSVRTETFAADATYCTIVITGVRMDATAAEKHVTGSGQALATNIQFFRRSTTSLDGETVTVIPLTLRLRDGTNSVVGDSISLVGWGFQSKPSNILMDLNCDGGVSVGEVLQVRTAFNQGASFTNTGADLNGDGGVSVGEVLQTRTAFNDARSW